MSGPARLLAAAGFAWCLLTGSLCAAAGDVPAKPDLADPSLVSSWSEVSLAGSREYASPLTPIVFAVT